MKVWLRFLLVCAVAFAGVQGIAAEPAMLRNPPPKEDPDEEPEDDCECPPQEVNHGCVKIKLDLGRTSVLSGRRPVSLRVYTNTASEAIFTPEELKVVMDYTFDRFGPEWSDRNLPARVVFIQRTGQEIHFRFGNGESLGIPDPGLHRDLNERLQMVDAEGWATAEDPAYYDLYPGDGSVWRFYATDVTGRLGELVSHTDPRGRVTTLEDFGVEIVRGPHGWVRQVLTPSRLADVTTVSGTEYQVAVYPLTERPAMSEGVYVPPQTTPLRRLTMKRGTNGRELLTTLQKGNGQPREYAYTFVNEDWGLRTPEGLDKTRELMESDDGGTVQAVTLTQKGGEILKQKKELYEEADWGFAKVRSTEGAGNATRWKTWDYYFTTDPANGAYKGKVKERRTSGGEIVRYRYDAQGRTVETVRTDTAESFLEVTTASYQPVAAGDVTSLMDTRPRCEVVAERDPESGEMVEVSRTYHVYLPTQEIVERAAVAGAAYGAAGALRTVRTWYAPDDATPYCAGRLKSVRDEDGSLRLYTYGLEGERWTETVTSLHEQASEPISGKTTRDSTVYDRVGNVVERNEEVFIEGTWHLIDRTIYEYNEAGKVTKETDFAGRETVSVWGDACCGKISETLPNGVCHTYAYDAVGNLLAQTTLKDGSHTVTYRRDALGRVIRVEREGLNPTTTGYDLLGRVVRTVDVQGGVTRTLYGADETTVTNLYPNLATRIVRKDARGRTLSVEGSAVQPQTFTYGPNWERVATGARWQKTEQNLLGQTLRQTRSGVNGSTLETLMTYDGYGRISQIRATGQPVQTYAYDATGEQTAFTQTVGEEWRKQQSDSAYLLREGEVWRMQTAVQSCSDTTIAPLAQTAYAQLSGLSVTNTFNQITVDIRGNETRTFGNDTQRTTQAPSCSNPQIERYAFGQLVETVDTACVTNRFEYDALDRRIASIDGRNNRTVYAYDAKGNLVSTTDAVGAVTAYGYDVMGQTVAVTNALGNVTTYEYDLRGNRTYEGGATYPVRYVYDVFGNKTSMTTYRNEASGVGDTTTWAYDEASGVLIAKTYADGKGLTYTYTNDGRLATRTNARNIVTTYTYDDWGQLLSVDYADTTPDIAYVYDAMGRQTSAIDAVGTTTFTYNAFGQLTSEHVNGLYAKTLTRHYDTFGRNMGYSVDNDRKQSITYDSATGRIAESDGFRWEYLQGTNLKKSIIYPNNCKVTWSYEPRRDLVSSITNSSYSIYSYTYDLLGRRVSQNDLTVKHNLRNEIVSIDDTFYLQYDDAGNRKCAGDIEYVTNNCNQYISIDMFSPTYDADGNQTKIKTSTGIWDVQYDAENRPIRWFNERKTILMVYDERGRRVKFHFAYDGDEKGLDYTHYFFYNDYKCIECMREGSTLQSFVWNPVNDFSSEILKFYDHAGDQTFYYMHDAMRNVVTLVDARNLMTGNYKYSIFGSIISSRLSDTTSSYDVTMQNRFCFSSEWFDVELGLVYYNYRSYHPIIGRWISRDPLLNAMPIPKSGIGVDYLFVKNNPFDFVDFLGLVGKYISIPHTRNIVRYNPPNPDAGVNVPHVDICDVGGNKIASFDFNQDGTLGPGREGSSEADISKKTREFIERKLGPKARKYFNNLKECPPCPSNNPVSRNPVSQASRGVNVQSKPATPRPNIGASRAVLRGGGGIAGGGSAGGGCFKAGTPVLTPNGLCAIENLNIGDVVLTYDFKKECVQQNRIVDKIEVLTEDILTIKTHTDGILECSYKHLFYTTNGEKRAEQLVVGDVLLGKDSTGRLVPIRIVEIDGTDVKPQKVYNLGIETNHNFFVGNDAILTHNQKPFALKSPMLFGM